ncbi:MAG TPA: LuxR C-terminal-related transcriptional regulator [Mycobacterium sp.]|nr:LuxR C-terminal-related transcriptional regulator [Mycobacterium sp.]
MTSVDTLTGRDDELAALRRALSGTGNYAGVVIAGPAGVGKTRLARELISEAAAAGSRTNWIVGTASARPIPLGAFAVALGPNSAPMAESAPSIRRVINALVSQQNPRRILIGVDDAHQLDGFSAHVVHQLAQTREARLVVTVRTGVPEPDAVTALWKDGLLSRLDLEPLSVESTRAVVEAALDGPLDKKSAKRFWRLTGGNALFIQQLVKDQLSAGRLRQVAGVWMWDGDVAVSQSMSDLVGHRLDQLPPNLAMALDALSLCEPLEVDVLTDLVGSADLEVAEQMNLVRVERSGGRLMASLAHPIFGELRRAAAGEIYLSRLRGRLAERLGERTEKTPEPDPQRTVVRAQLTLDSDLQPDPALLLEAAEHAMRMNEIDLAMRFANAAATHDPAAAARLQALCLVITQGGDDAEEFLKGIVAANDEERRRWALLRAENTVWMRGKPAEAAAILAELATDDETDADRAARLALEACVDAVLARCVEGEQKAAVALESGTLSDLTALLAARAFVMSAGALGHVSAIAPVFDEAIERATHSHETSSMRFWFGGVYLRACRITGWIEECQRATALLTALDEDAPGRASANLLFLRGHAALIRGELREAVRLLHEALATAQQHGVATLRPACYFALVEAHAKLGESAEAAEMLANARAVVPPDFLFMQTALAVAIGWAQAAAGELADAVQTVLSEAAVARTRNQPTHELACLQAAIQWGAGDRLSDVAVRARELADVLKLPLAETIAVHAESLRDGDGDRLLSAVEGYRKIGDRCTAADAAAQAAVLLTGAQMRSRGIQAASIASELAQQCGGLCTPATRSPVSPTPLTGRQREVAELVAAGLSNKEIADRLVTSPRTVEGHILKACQRVGATSRGQLAAIMRSGMALR